MEDRAPIKKLSSISILVVDDEEGLREVLREELEYEGAKIIEAENGKAGLEKLKTNKIDVVISDIRMPILDGISFLKTLRLDCPVTPLFFLCTGYSDTSVQQAKRLGANDLFSKPYNINAMITRILSDLEKNLNKKEIPSP